MNTRLSLGTLCLLVALALPACSDSNIGTNNSPPEASILVPESGLVLLEGLPVDFRGQVSDRLTDPGELRVSWSSSLDSQLFEGSPDGEGITELSWSELSVGEHTITLRVVDPDGAAGTDTVELVILANSPPAITIDSPSSDGVYYSDLPVTLSAAVSDAEDQPEELRVDWALDDGTVLATGLEPSSEGATLATTDLAVGVYTAVATVLDTAGKTSFDSVAFEVGAPSTDPDCAITSPASGSSAPVGDLVILEGTVSDADVPADWLLVDFESNVDGPLDSVTPTTGGEVLLAVSTLTATTHTITMNVADEVGGTCTAAILLTISNPPTAEILTPLAGELLNDNDTVPLSGEVHDPEDADSNLVVEWSSDLEGVLGASIPDSSGAVALNVTDLGSGTHLLTLTATDSVGLTGTDTVTIDINASPTAPVVSILPALPSTDDDLSVSIDTPSTDPDSGPDPLEYAYSWTLNGNPMPAYDGLTSVPAADTESLQTWAVYVVATDGLGSSAPGSAAVAIGNSIPSILSASVSPLVGLETDTFTVTPSGWSDLDGDPEDYQYQWYAGTTPIAGATSATVIPLGQPAGTSIWCEVTPWDGLSTGLPVSSALAAINTPPGVAGVVITPSSAYETTTLTASYALTTDIDGQPVAVAWQWSSALGPIAGATSDTLDGTSFSKGDVITVTGTPNDGLEAGAPATSTSVDVLNSLPSVASVAIDPGSGTEDTTFSCEPSGWSDDDSDPEGYTWSWTVDGSPSVTTQTIDGTSFDSGDPLICTATPFDGEASGTPVSSSPVTVDNTVPSITSVVIDPSSGTEATTFSCEPSGWSDSDGDPEDYTWAWTVGGSPSVATQTIDGASFDKGDALVCTATPVDSSSTGTPLSSGPVTVGNTAPEISSVSISPGSGYETTTFSCVPSGWLDIDPADSVPGYTWQWTVDGAPSVTTQSIDGDDFSKGDILACTATPTDGEDPGTPVSSTTLTVSNSLPVLASVAIDPASGNEDTTFTCEPGAWSDADGDTEGYTWSWTVDGSPSVLTQTIDGSSFDSGDVLVCTGTPFDGEDPGTPVSSSPVTVDNSAPSITSVSIDPLSGTEATTFSCEPSGWSDIDGDPEDYTWAWTVGGAPSVTTQTIDGASFDKGDALVCTATPVDSSSSGTPLSSAAVTVGNTAPEIGSVSISPGSGYETTTFSCVPSGWLDIDPADSVPGYTWQWTVDGAPSVTTQSIDGDDFSKGDILACTATPFDGEDSGTPLSSTTLTVSNSLPVLASVAIDPASGSEDTTFTCEPGAWSDADGDPEGYTWSWTVDGSPSVTTQTIDGSSFDSGDVLVCTGTPFDGEDPGSPVSSASVTVDNSAPSITSVTIDPPSGTEATTFSCEPSGWSDPDGDPEDYTWAWTVGGSPSVTTQTIDGASFDKGDALVCTATPVDSSSSGTPLSSGAVTVGNTAPEIGSVSISPSSGYETTTFSCVPSGWLDIDPADSVPGYTWQWTVNASASVTTQTIDGASFSKGDLLACTATPTDGEDPGTPLSSATLAVSNSLPSVASVAIDPASGTEDTTFTCEPGAWSDADGDPEGYTWSWTVDGSPSVATQTIDGSSFDSGDVLVCTGTPFDGEDPGSPVSSAAVTVGNSLPSITTVSIDPTSGYETTTFLCLPNGWSDSDGDPEGYTYQWYVGVTASVTTETIDGGSFDKGDMLYCEATPFDGENSGTPVSSAVVTVLNTAPEISSVSIDPGSGYETTTFDCLPSGWSDPDPADTVPGYTWSWTVNASASVATQSIDGASFDSGDSLVCTATPTDGESSGTPLSSSTVVVSNSEPEVASVSITPSTAYTDTTLTALPSGWYDADGAPESYLYEWFEGGVNPVGGDAPTLAGGEFGKGEVITVQITPEDSSSSGTPVTSAGVTILNSLPTAPGVEISPAAPTDADDLVCSVTTPSTDLDVDTVSYSYAWLVDSVASSYTTATLPSSATAVGETWTCEVTPYDGEDDGPVGTASVGPIVEADCTGHVLDFDGIDDHVMIGEPSSLDVLRTGNFTVEAWVKPAALGSPMAIFSMGDEGSDYENKIIVAKVESGGTIFGRVRGDTGESSDVEVFSSTALTPGQWTHVALVRDYAEDLHLYIDGVLEDSTSDTAGYVTFSGYETRLLKLGVTGSSSVVPYHAYFEGSLADVRFWNTVRSAAEIADNMETEVASDASGLIGHFLLDEGSGVTTSDATGGAADAELEGAAWSGELDLPYCVVCLSTTTAQGMDFVRLCSGSFEMGCTPAQVADGNCASDESPVHSVTLTKDFWMGEVEVTQDQWQDLMGSTPSYLTSCGLDCPVEQVNWYEALELANALSSAEGLEQCYSLTGCSGVLGEGCSSSYSCVTGTYTCSSVVVNSLSGSPYDCEGYRLPTEAEWEYATRAGTDLLYSGSDSIGDVAWYDANSGGSTHPVGSLLSNGWGLYDLSGNVFESVWDWYSGSYYSSSSVTDPEGPTSGGERGYRGGSWSTFDHRSRVSYRDHTGSPALRSSALGLRLARTVPVDADGDGVLAPEDCDDSDASIVSSPPASVSAQGIDLVGLCSGTFEMGCTEAQVANGSCEASESPAHGVTLTKDFWLAETELTQDQWQDLIGNNPSSFSSCGSDCPVESVNWWEALALVNELSSAEGLEECYTLSGCSSTVGNGLDCTDVTINSPTGASADCEGYRLPTEAEWEYAARAGGDLIYAGSDTADEVAWHSGNSGASPQAVAGLLPNDWGLYDMSGNVREWCWDWFDASYYSSSPAIDPEGPSSGSGRVDRSGTWIFGEVYTRVSYRHFVAPDFSSSGFGLRPARTVPVDADDDGFFMYEDCDDDDDSVLSNADDADCDGVLTADDCDDADPTSFEADGSSEACAAASCLEILEGGYSEGDGAYWLDPNGTGPELYVCDMSTDGGGWTGITFPQADTRLGGSMTSLDSAATAGIDPTYGPYTRDGSDHHAYQYDFGFDPTWTQFYFGVDFLLASNACSSCTSDIWNCWYQTSWSTGYHTGCASTGDVSYGNPADSGPVTSLALEVLVDMVYPGGQTIAWPVGTAQYTSSSAASAFRLAWGEAGGDHEGWYPWYAGTLYLR